VYLGSAFLRFLILLAFPRINNLRVFNATNSSIPTIPPRLNDCAIGKKKARQVHRIEL
jgi:hypothetical protein